jgi:hypothetical protein
VIAVTDAESSVVSKLLDFITYMERYTREHSAHSAEELNTIVT